MSTAQQYKAAAIVYYDCGEESQRNHEALFSLCKFDEGFESYLKSSRSLQLVFDKLRNGGYNLSTISELEEVSIMYIVHAIFNRCRFACDQKLWLSKCFSRIFDEDARKDVAAAVDEELRYVKGIVESISIPQMVTYARQISDMLSLDLNAVGVVAAEANGGKLSGVPVVIPDS